ncbi:hypothetical protein BDZ91DRAFT_829681 [Kalaharituber pfeilii]|nr:hypothetical protein BDZ91DRAFT_829681 [Kalaharituber pfeilii]
MPFLRQRNPNAPIPRQVRYRSLPQHPRTDSRMNAATRPQGAAGACEHTAERHPRVIAVPAPGRFHSHVQGTYVDYAPPRPCPHGAQCQSLPEKDINLQTQGPQHHSHDHRQSDLPPSAVKAYISTPTKESGDPVSASKLGPWARLGLLDPSTCAPRSPHSSPPTINPPVTSSTTEISSKSPWVKLGLLGVPPSTPDAKPAPQQFQQPHSTSKKKAARMTARADAGEVFVELDAVGQERRRDHHHMRRVKVGVERVYWILLGNYGDTMQVDIEGSYDVWYWLLSA